MKRILGSYILRIIGTMAGILGCAMPVGAQAMSKEDAVGVVKSKYETLQKELEETERQYRAATLVVEARNLSERMGEIIDGMIECRAFLDVGMIDASKISDSKYLEVGLKLLNAGHPDEALTFLEFVAEKGNCKVANLVAVIYMDNGNFDKSIEFLEIASGHDGYVGAYLPVVYNFAQVFFYIAQMSESEELKNSYLLKARDSLEDYQKLLAQTFPSDNKYAIPPFSIKEYMNRGNPNNNDAVRYLLLGKKLEQEIKFQEMGLK